VFALVYNGLGVPVVTGVLLPVLGILWFPMLAAGPGQPELRAYSPGKPQLCLTVQKV
jgi:hypothetical protein